MPKSIIGRFSFWVNYQISVTYRDGNGFDIHLQSPEWPPRRQYKMCQGEIAVFHFDQQISHKEVLHRVRKEGFRLGDIWCLLSLLRELPVLQICQEFLNKPTCIVAPAGIIYDQRRGRISPFLNVINETIFVDFVHRAETDWSGYWLPHWKFLAVRWIGQVIRREEFVTALCGHEQTVFDSW